MCEQSTEPIEIEGCDTLSKLFRYRVHQLGDQVALREKKLGLWQAVSWADYGARVKEIGIALLHLGLNTGDVCCILGENSKEWFFSHMGILSAGGIASGIYSTDSSRQVEYLLNHSESKFLFLQNEEQLDKVISIQTPLPHLKHIIVFEPHSLRDVENHQMIFLEDFYALGRKHLLAEESNWKSRISNSSAQDIALIIYTSGTTGDPKGVMLSNRNIVFQILTSRHYIQASSQDSVLCFLPLNHIAENLFSLSFPLLGQSVVHFVEESDTIPENLREVAPTVFLGVPRIWEKLYSSVMLRVQEATGVGQAIFYWAVRQGKNHSSYKLQQKTPPFFLRCKHFVAEGLVLANIRRMMGLDGVRWPLSGAAPISTTLLEWYWSIGVHVCDAYGQSECTGVSNVNTPEEFRIDRIGKPLPGTEVKIVDSGELLIRGPHVFSGYYKDAGQTQKTLNNGWLHTGDIGEEDEDGFFRITGRLKDLIITAGGKNISPSEIEKQLKRSLYIADAVVIGDARKYLTCLISADDEGIVLYAQDHHIPFTDYKSLCQSETIIALIAQEIESVNEHLAQVETIKRFRILDQKLDVEDEEVTSTLKLKRAFVAKKYKTWIDAMYDSR